MKVRLLLPVALLMTWSVLADMPGNKPRQSVTIRVSLGELSGYTIFANGPYGNYGDDEPVRDSAEILLPGGYGEPPCVIFFGVDGDDQHTDSLYVCSEEQGLVFLKLSVSGGKLISETVTEPERNETAPVVTDDENPEPGASAFQINLLVGVAFASMLLLLAAYYFTQRKRQAV